MGAQNLEMAGLRKKDGGRKEVDGGAGRKGLEGVERVALCWVRTPFESRPRRRHFGVETQ